MVREIAVTLVINNLESNAIISTQNQTQNMVNFPSSPNSQSLLENDNSTPTPTGVKIPSKLSLIPLIFIIYFEVAGGPYGQEPTVGSAGPLFAILGFLIFPFLWSIPEALITAELSTTFPGNGGFVIWADQAFGPFWGSMLGFWKLTSGIINLASYGVLCVDYLKLTFPVFSSGLPHYLAILIYNLMLSFLNYTGLKIVGYASVSLGVASLLPFVIMSVMAIPKIDPSRWFSWGEKGVEKDWTSFINTLFWNLNSWDNASTLAGEIEEPQKTYPKAIFSAVLLTCLAYVIPLLASIGSIPLNQPDWVDGYYANVAEMIAGTWLKLCIQIGAVLSAVGVFEAQLSCCAYQVAGMADYGFLPRVFGVRSEWFDTPWVGILISTLVALPVSYMSFNDIISSVNFLYSLGMVVEFSSFIWLRKKLAGLNRPFKVPFEIAGLVVMCLFPFGFLIYVIAMASYTVYVIGISMTLFGIACYFAIGFLKQRMPLLFSNDEK